MVMLNVDAHPPLAAFCDPGGICLILSDCATVREDQLEHLLRRHLEYILGVYSRPEGDKWDAWQFRALLWFLCPPLANSPDDLVVLDELPAPSGARQDVCWPAIVQDWLAGGGSHPPRSFST